MGIDDGKTTHQGIFLGAIAGGVRKRVGKAVMLTHNDVHIPAGMVKPIKEKGETSYENEKCN
jgi:hypothetical protein